MSSQSTKGTEEFNTFKARQKEVRRQLLPQLQLVYYQRLNSKGISEHYTARDEYASAEKDDDVQADKER
eukprot:1152981-Pelagomonas_calceolata.AAC.8